MSNLPFNEAVERVKGLRQTVVSAIDAMAMMSVASNPTLQPIAREANERFTRLRIMCSFIPKS